MDIRIEGLLSSLRLRHIHALFAENSADACQKVMGLIPPDAVVGIGDSTTMRQLGITASLKGQRYPGPGSIRAKWTRKRPRGKTDLSVVIIDEDLGLGWDPGWPKNRIEHIVENYKRGRGDARTG